MNNHRLNHASLNVAWLNRVGEPLPACKGVEVYWEEATYSGNDILFIKDMKFNSITKLALGGGCYQSGTPTPAAPLDILTNKGAIKLVRGKNLLEVKDDNIVVGKYINNAGVVTDSLPNLYFQRFVAVKPNTAYTLSTSETLNYANFMEYDADGVFIKRTLFGSSGTPAGKSVTHTMGETTAFVIVGSNVNGTKYPSITKEDVMGIKWMFVEGSTAASYQAYSEKISISGDDKVLVYNKNLSVGELVGKGYASTGSVSTSTTFCGNLHKIPVSEGQKYTVSWGNLPDGMSGVFINTWKTDGSWNARQAISATDKLTYTIPSGVGYVNFTLYKTGGITIGADTWLQVEYGDVATDYVAAITPTSTSAELLMGVDSYADTQDLVGGVVTRKVGYKVLDGTEAISTSNSVFTIGFTDKIRSKSELYCTHFAYSTSTSSSVANMKIISFASQNVGFRYDACADIESFRQFLQREHAKGTPVIVVYPLAEESTKNVSKKAVGNPKGDVTIIREANVDGLSMELVCSVKGEKPEDSGGLITFSIDGTEYQAENGMTWEQWCDSEYNTDWYYIDYPSVSGGGGNYELSSDGCITDGSGGFWTTNAVFKQDADLDFSAGTAFGEKPSDIIISGYDYTMMEV